MTKSKQERSRRTAERLLNAAESVASEVGFERLTLAVVARRAECTTGAVYGRFTNKAGLLDALHERHIERGTARLADQLRKIPSTGDRRGILEGLLALFVEEYEEHWPIIDAFGVMLPLHPSFAKRHVGLVKTLSQASSEVLGVPVEDMVLCVAMVMGTLDRTMRLRVLAPELPLPDNEALVRRLANACEAVINSR